MSNSKKEKRFRQKWLRSQQTVMRHENVFISNVPTNHLAVGNGGLCNGVKREEIQKLFSTYGEVIDIIMKPDKPYSFVTMESVAVAEKAATALNGQICPSLEELVVSGVTIYVFYVDSVPGYEAAGSKTLPRGLTIMKDFVTEEYETRLLQSVDWDILDKNISEGSHQSLKHRRVKHFGFEFLYSVNNVDVNTPLEYSIPETCKNITEKMLELGIKALTPDQLTVNEYQPGQGIPPHVDTHSAFDDVIVSLSLGSQAVMDFRHPDGRHVPVLLPQRSLAVMAGEARYVWTHGITPRKSDIVSEMQLKEECSATPEGAEKQSSKLTLLHRGVRTSFTFRNVLRKPCMCAFPEQCDSQQGKAGSGTTTTLTTSNVTPLEADIRDEGKEKAAVPVTDTEAQELEKRLVHQVYEEIAGHFSDTRHSPWPKVVEFLNTHPPASVILDVGCGNGKYLGANQSCYKIGSDRSVNLCSICRDRGHPVFVSDCLSVPVRENTVDVVISIAVIHHLSTQARRVAALKEIVKVLRPGGQALIYVWALEQELNKQKSNYLKQSKTSGTTDEVRNLTINHNPVCDSQINIEKRDDASSLRSNDLTGVEEKKNIPNENDMKQYLPVHINRTPFVSQDLLVPWHLRENKGKQNSDDKIDKEFKNATGNSESTEKMKTKESCVFHRYYHVFKQGELEKLCENVEGVNILNSYYDKGNWCVIIQKS